MPVTDYVLVTESNQEEYNRLLARTSTTGGGETTSPFQEGFRFKILKEKDKSPIVAGYNKDKDRVITMVLAKCTTTNQNVEIWLSMLTKVGNEEGKRIVSDAEINKAFVDKVRGRTLTNKEFAEAFVDIVGDKEFEVKRTYYQAMSRDRRAYTASVVGFNFVK